MKFLIAHGIGVVHGNEAFTKQCYMASLQARPPNAIPVECLDTQDKLTEEWEELVEDFLTFSLHDGNPQHIICIGSRLDKTTR